MCGTSSCSGRRSGRSGRLQPLAALELVRVFMGALVPARVAVDDVADLRVDLSAVLLLLKRSPRAASVQGSDDVRTEGVDDRTTHGDGTVRACKVQEISRECGGTSDEGRVGLQIADCRLQITL